jgi:toxin CptA
MKGNIEAVDCEFKYSGLGLALVCAGAGATAALVAFTPLSGALRTSLVLGVVALACRALKSIRSVRRLRLDGSRGVQLEFARAVPHSGMVRDGSFVAAWLTIMRWRPEGRRLDRFIVILPGMLSEERYRALRVLLRWN